MKSPRTIKTSSIPAVLAALAVTAFPLPSLAAKTYELSGEFTSFRTWLVPDATTGLVNGTLLTDSGTVAGTKYGATFDWSNPIALGSGTSSVDFGYDPAIVAGRLENNFSFGAGTNVTVNPGIDFKLGSLSFTNGQWFPVAEVAVHFVATPTDGSAASEFFDTVELIVNSGGATPEEEADYFYLAGHPELGSVRVYDAFSQPAGNPGFVGTVDFIAKIGSLDPVAFVSTSSAAFVNASTTAPLSAVPEPSTWALFAFGLTGLAGATFRNRRRPV